MCLVEMTINEDAHLNVIQHYDLRRLLTRLWAKALWRHHVVKSSTCMALTNIYTDRLPVFLKYVFIAVVGFSLIRTLCESVLLPRGPTPPWSAGPPLWVYPYFLFFVLIIMVVGGALAALCLCLFKQRGDRTLLLVPLLKEDHLDTISRVIVVKRHTTTPTDPECHGGTPALPPPYIFIGPPFPPPEHVVVSDSESEQSVC